MATERHHSVARNAGGWLTCGFSSLAKQICVIVLGPWPHGGGPHDGAGSELEDDAGKLAASM